MLRGVATGIAGAVTIFVLSYLMVLEGPKIVDGYADPVRRQHRERIRRVGTDCAKSVTGYISGNLLISVICGVLTYVVLKVIGRAVRRADRAVRRPSPTSSRWSAPRWARSSPCIAGVHPLGPRRHRRARLLRVYQQLENHLLQPVILSRTVKLNPLTVLVAILVGVELAGILGALLAIPFAGIIQVIIRDVWDHRRGRLKEEPTTGEDEHRPGEERPAPLTS